MKTELKLLAVILCAVPLLAGCKNAARAFANGAMNQPYQPVFRGPSDQEERIQRLEQELNNRNSGGWRSSTRNR